MGAFGNKFTSLLGQSFDRLTVVEFAGRNAKGKILWLCECICRKRVTVAAYSLRSGNTKSCGCYHLQRNGDVHRTHGGSKTSTYRIWFDMLRRCTKPYRREFQNYGCRGIKVCERWKRFENFLADMGDKPTGMMLDRYPNNDGNYETSNCRWATRNQQNSNKRNNVWLEFKGEKRTVSQWEKHLGWCNGTIKSRLYRGWSVEEALTA